MLVYNDKVMGHLMNPRDVGEIGNLETRFRG